MTAGDMIEAFDMTGDGEDFYTTPANSPQQQTYIVAFDLWLRGVQKRNEPENKYRIFQENREIQSGVFQGIQIPMRVSETPQNTPMAGSFKVRKAW